VSYRDWISVSLTLLAVFLLCRRVTADRRPRLPLVSWEDQASGYKVYQRAYDEEVSADKLAKSRDLARRRRLFDVRLAQAFYGAGERRGGLTRVCTHRIDQQLL